MGSIAWVGLVALLLLLGQAGRAAPAAAGEDQGNRTRDVRALEAELRLAGREKIYFLMDARDATLRIKAAGLTLKTLPIARWVRWGDPVGPVARALLRKSTLFEPKRPTITPDAPDSATEATGLLPSPQPASELNALELKDMPARYRLALDQGIRITVRPEPEGVASRVWEWAYTAAWYLARPFPTVWNALRGRPYTALYLRIAAQDARALYWACREGTEFLLIIP